jgi:adenylate cyclase
MAAAEVGSSTGAPSRRLAAILAADVVGYSRLMGADEEGTFAALRALRGEIIGPQIARHHGRLVKTTGDGLLVEFASVVDALRCATAWQQDVARCNADIPEQQRIVFRIGINLGDVIVENEDIHGDGVNIAARLEALARPGTICLSRAARDQVRDRLPVSFRALGEVNVKNIARPVQAFLVEPSAEETNTVRARRTARSRYLSISAVALIGSAAIAGVLAGLTPWATLTDRQSPPVTSASPDLPLPVAGRASIAVLRFNNLGGDAQNLRLDEALAENLISSLSKLPQMFVIARNSTFAYSGRAVTAQQVAEELGVRYVLEGSVQQAGARVRINTRLVDAMNGSSLWSEIYDHQIDDIFALQDDITLKVVTALQIELTQGEVARVRQRGTNNLRAWLLVNESLKHLLRFTRQDNTRARELAEQAIALDPNYPEAYIRLGRAHLADFHAGWSPNRDVSLQRSIELARRALALDPNYPDTYHLLSAIYLFVGRHDDALLSIRKALDLSPSHSLAQANLGMILTYSGEPDAAIPVLKEAMRLSPTYSAWFLNELARAHLQTGSYDEAIQILHKCLEREPDNGEGLILLTAAYSAAGRLDEARAALTRFLGPRPAYTLRHYATGEFYRNRQDLDRMLEALRTAGLPE